MITILKITVVGIMLTAGHHHAGTTTFAIPFDTRFTCEDQLRPSATNLDRFFSASKRVNPKMLPKSFTAECVDTGQLRL
jgi:hypothetical protein